MPKIKALTALNYGGQPVKKGEEFEAPAKVADSLCANGICEPCGGTKKTAKTDPPEPPKND